MGRRKEHDEDTAAALVDAAERIVQVDGLDALTVRRVATEVGTTTRAVYSLFGSKEGLVVALGRRAFAILADGLDELPVTDDPAADLVEAGVRVFRRFALEHPSLFHVAVQRPPSIQVGEGFRAVGAEALDRLRARVERLDAAGRLGDRPVWAAVLELHALCEGLAAVELRGQLRLRPDALVLLAYRVPVGDADELGLDGEDGGFEARVWRDALTSLVRGFAS